MKTWLLLSQWLGNERCARLFGVRTFLTADLHLGHQSILSYCPDRGERWDTTDEMNADIIRLWNETVRPWDEVYVLGDACMGKIVDSLALIKQLQGSKYLVAGNHDRCSPLYERNEEKRLKWVNKYTTAGFEMIFNRETTLVFSYNHQPVEVLLHHFPYTGDSHEEDRYPEARPKDTGKVLLHGHIHDARLVEGRQVNVGMDVWGFRPVRLEKAYSVARSQQQ